MSSGTKRLPLNLYAQVKVKFTAEFKISEEMLQEIYTNTENSDKFLPSYELEVLDEQQKVVCILRKTLYIKNVKMTGPVFKAYRRIKPNKATKQLNEACS